MPRLSPIFALQVVLVGSCPGVADEPVPKQAPRVIAGRILDAEGRVPPGARVMFGPQNPPIPFTEATTAALDAEGRFRIELTRFELESETFPVTGLLRYLVLAPGFRAEAGQVAAGPGPDSLDIRLTPEAWKTTEIRVVDRDGRPVAGVELTLAHGANNLSPWRRLTSDAEGRSRVSTAPGQPFAITTRLEGYLPDRSGLRGTVDDPTSLTLPLFPTIRGRVVDADGKPLPGIKVGKAIGPDDTSNDPGAADRTIVYRQFGTKGPSVTDSDGRFTTEPLVLLDTRTLARSGEFRIMPQTLCFADPTFRQVAFLGVDPKAFPPLLEITLRPGRSVRIPIEHEVAIPSGKLESWWDLIYYPGVIRPGAGLRVMDGVARVSKPGGDEMAGEWIEADLPPGNYQITVHSVDPKADRGVEETQSDLVVSPGEGPLVLPPIRLTASAQHKLIGQPAPEIEAKDLDSGEPIKLADFRGKVVVLDFWGYWCGPCVSSMPELAEAHRRFQGKPVAILGLHDQSVQSREEYDRKLSGVKKSLWNSQDLPFRVALDRPDPELAAGAMVLGQGVSCKRYDVRGFPTTFVIDRDGKVAGTVNALDHGKLSTMIEELLAKDAPR